MTKQMKNLCLKCETVMDIEYTIRGYYDRGKIVVNITNMDITYWSVRSSSTRGRCKEGGWGHRYFSQVQVLLYYKI